jgi:hypothetical protein
MKRIRYCKNCEAAVYPEWRLFLCRDCRRAVRWTFIIGGFVCGAAVKALTHWGWL